MAIKTKYFLYFVFVCGLFVLDRLFKYLGESEKVIGFLKIGGFPNYHGLFGLVGIPEISFISLLVLVLLVFLFWRAGSQNEKFALLTIFVGGLLNLFDRIAFGFVRDNFALGNLGYFNFADVLVGVGVLFLVGGIVIKK